MTASEHAGQRISMRSDNALYSACASVRGKPSVFFNQATMIMPWRSGLNLEALDVDAEQDLDAVADQADGLSWSRPHRAR